MDVGYFYSYYIHLYFTYVLSIENSIILRYGNLNDKYKMLTNSTPT